MIDWTSLIFSRREEDVRVVDDRLERARVGHHVRGDVAVVELEVLDEVHRQAQHRGVLDGDHAVVADGVQRLARRPRPIASSSLAEIAATRREVLLGRHGVRHGRQVLDERADGEVDAPLDQHRVAARPRSPSCPARTIACASTVAVVVPSPTVSLVLTAASLTSWAPMFSNGSRRWISRAMVTPSLVTSGEPVIFSRMTLRPLGPSVLFTASASWSTPACSRRRRLLAESQFLGHGGPPGAVTSVRLRGCGTTSRAAARRAIAAARRPGSSVADGLEVEVDVLGRVLGVGEHDRPVVEVDHPPVVGGHVLLELGGVEPALLLAEGLVVDIGVDEVDPADGVDADHRRQVRDGDVVLAAPSRRDDARRPGCSSA